MLLARKRGVETTQEINVHLVARRHLAATREQYERAKRARTKGRRRSDDSIPVRVTNEERIHQSQMIHDCPQVARNVKEITPRCFDHARRNTWRIDRDGAESRSRKCETQCVEINRAPTE
jgi:hypothetical protein